MAGKQPSFRVKINYRGRDGADGVVENKFWITPRDKEPSPNDALTVPIYTDQDGIDVAKKQFKEHLAIHGAIWTSLTVTGPGSTKFTHRETNPDAEKEQAKSGSNDGPSAGKYQGSELDHYTMAYHGSIRRSAGEVETDQKNLVAWVEKQRQAGAVIPNWKLARLQGYEDALVSLGGSATAQSQATGDKVAVSGPADEIRRDYLKFARKSDAELLSQYGYGGPGEHIRRAAVQNLVAAYARATGMLPAEAEKALVDYAARSGE